MPLASSKVGHLGVGLVTALRVPDGETRIAVLATGALLDRRPGHSQFIDELGSPGVADAVHRPDASVLLEVRGHRRVPVLGVDHEGIGRLGLLDLAVDGVDHVFAAADVEAAIGMGEVVLHVDDKQSGGRVVLGLVHCS